MAEEDPDEPVTRRVWFESFYCDGDNLFFDTPSRARLGQLRRRYRTVWQYTPDDMPYVFPEEPSRPSFPVANSITPGPT